MKKKSGFKITFFKRGEVEAPKFVFENLTLGLEDTAMLAVSSDLSRVMLARPDLPDALYPKNLLRMVYATVKNRRESTHILYAAALLQIAGADFEIGAYSKYRRIYDESGKVCAIVFSRSKEDRAADPGNVTAPNDSCLTGLLEESLSKVLLHKSYDGPKQIPYLPYSTLRQRGYIDRHGHYTEKATRATEIQGADD